MPYVLLGTAIVLEIIATTLLKSSEGFTKLLPAVFCILFYILCFFIFSKALNSINLGVAYATWCAGGIVATAVISAAVFGEEAELDRNYGNRSDRNRLYFAESLWKFKSLVWM